MSFEILHEWKGHLEIFSPPQRIKNSKQYLRLRNRHITENSRWVRQNYY